MMENESLRGSKNTTVIFLSLLLVLALIWAIAASVIATKRAKAFDIQSQEMAQLKADTEQKLMEADRQKADAERLRKVALEWTRQHQLQLQAEQQKKAAEAAKAAAAAASKTNKVVKAASTTATKTPVKKTGKKVVRPAH
jgi:hypothetical protein